MINQSNAIIPAYSSRLHCIRKLVQRRLLIFYRDKTDFYITFGQAPALVAAFFFVFNEIITVDNHSFFIPLRNYLNGDTVSLIVFLAVLTSVWFGTSKAILEIPNSKNLYQQERLSFLKNSDYLLSIFISLSLITFVQVFLFVVGFYLLFILIPAYIDPLATGLIISERETISFFDPIMPLFLIKFIVLMWFISVASVALAMFISVFIATPSAASAILPFVLIVQILMSGSAIKPIIEMNSGVRLASSFMISRWGFESVLLLFEQNLNFDMPLYKEKNNDFKTFSFSGSGILNLKKTNPNDYLNSLNNNWELNNNYPLVVTDIKHYEILLFWYKALYEAMDEESVFNLDINKKQKEELKKIKKLFKEVKRYKNYLENNVEKENKVDFYQLKDMIIPDWILNKAKKIFLGETDSYANKVADVFSNLNKAKTGLGNDIFNHALLKDTDLILFRVENKNKTWFMLFFMTSSLLLLTGFFFNKSRKKLFF